VAGLGSAKYPLTPLTNEGRPFRIALILLVGVFVADLLGPHRPSDEGSRISGPIRLLSLAG
jgi:hypothetical protein